MFYTAQIREADNFCFSVTETKEPLSNPPIGVFFIPLDSYHEEYAGMIYVPADGTFIPRS